MGFQASDVILSATWKSTAMFFIALVVACLPHLQHVSAVNPVSAPIITGELNVHTRRFARILDFQGQPAKIVCMVPLLDELYVCTLTAIYRVTSSGQVFLFLDVATAIQSATGRSLSVESIQHGGVRSIAFHPLYFFTGLFYVSAMEERPSDPAQFPYVSDAPLPIAADSVIIEFEYVSSIRAVPASSYRNVLRIGMPVYDHPIKQIAFYGPYLYIAHGDGSVQSATAGGGQRNDALGKILRIDPLQRGDQSYTVPTSNPFVNNPSMKSEVWALGFRNPHNFCFGSGGALFVADSGRSNVEEVNLVLPGRNYGWAAREGTFVHVGGGLLTGVQSLPPDDARFGYEYPVAQVGHEGEIGAGIIGQAIAGGFPVENGSPMDGNYYYADFPISGRLFYSKLSEMYSAITRGPPLQLTQAPTRQAKIFFDHDDNPSTPPLMFDNLADVMRSEPGFESRERVDLRFGRGRQGEMYWSSKTNGRIYLFTSSLLGGPGGPV